MRKSEFSVEKFHPIFQRALLLEANAEELLSYSTGKVPYWGLIRLPLMIQLFDRAREESNYRDIYLNRPAVALGKALRYAVASLWRSPFWYSNKDLVFFCSGVKNFRDNGVYFNSRVDYFAERVADSRILLVEGAYDLHYSWPRARGPVSFKGGLTIPAIAWGKIRRRGVGEGERIRSFMALLRAGIGSVLGDIDYDVLERYLRRSVGRAHASYAACGVLLDRLRPRMIFLENAHGGGDIELITAARERGVLTVEYQHGAIIPFCPHHNFHPNFLASGYGKHLPDYFLSYGDYWTEFLTTTAKVVSIGNPHVSTVMARLPQTAVTKKSVYFLSSANDPVKYIEHLRELRAHGFAVTFRPHPVERPLLAERYGTFFEDMHVEVDLSENHLSLVPRYEFVISDAGSTALFEAFAIAGERVFVMEMNEHLTDALPTHEFLRTVNTAGELELRGAEAPNPNLAIERIFAPHWEQRFSGFLSDALAASV